MKNWISLLVIVATINLTSCNSIETDTYEKDVYVITSGLPFTKYLIVKNYGIDTVFYKQQYQKEVSIFPGDTMKIDWKNTGGFFTKGYDSNGYIIPLRKLSRYDFLEY